MGSFDNQEILDSEIKRKVEIPCFMIDRNLKIMFILSFNSYLLWHNINLGQRVNVVYDLSYKVDFKILNESTMN